MKTLAEILSDLTRAANERDTEARKMFIEARQGKEVNGAVMTRLNDESRALEDAAKVLRALVPSIWHQPRA